MLTATLRRSPERQTGALAHGRPAPADLTADHHLPIRPAYPVVERGRPEVPPGPKPDGQLEQQHEPNTHDWPIPEHRSSDGGSDEQERERAGAGAAAGTATPARTPAHAPPPAGRLHRHPSQAAGRFSTGFGAFSANPRRICAASPNGVTRSAVTVVRIAPKSAPTKRACSSPSRPHHRPRHQRRTLGIRHQHRGVRRQAERIRQHQRRTPRQRTTRDIHRRPVTTRASPTPEYDCRSRAADTTNANAERRSTSIAMTTSDALVTCMTASE